MQYIHTRVYLDIYIYTHTAYVSICKCVNVYIQTYLYMYIYIYLHIYTHKYTHMCKPIFFKLLKE